MPWKPNTRHRVTLQVLVEFNEGARNSSIESNEMPEANGNISAINMVPRLAVKEVSERRRDEKQSKSMKSLKSKCDKLLVSLESITQQDNQVKTDSIPETGQWLDDHQ